MATREEVLRALSTIRDPDLGRDVVARGMVKDLDIKGGRVAFTMELTTPADLLRRLWEALNKPRSANWRAGWPLRSVCARFGACR